MILAFISTWLFLFGWGCVMFWCLHWWHRNVISSYAYAPLQIDAVLYATISIVIAFTVIAYVVTQSTIIIP